ncbi:glycosyltransferase family 2 protein [Candidatus Saccharibacteria bacterium]|nr:glycosyltransferase family 2 protein [Candidatus Saccharibacteria bacterium]
MSEKKTKFITVFIPTYNGEANVAQTIEAVINQELPAGYEMEFLIIDSGSSDNTLNIIERYSNQIRLEKIPNSEFSHGGTRSKAAHMSKGEFVLFLTQDATPTNYRWLINMLEPFFVSEKIGCVFGRQVPRPNAAPTIKREVSGVFGALGASDSIVISRNKSLVDGQKTNQINNFFSDVNSAVRRSLLVGEVPFRKVNYAEDQSLAEDMQKKGYLKAYAPLGEVWHSNDYTARQYFHRKFDEYVGLYESVNYKLVASKKSLVLGWIRPTLADWKFIRKDSDYSFKSKLVWFFESPLYNFGLKAGQYFAAKSLKDSKVSNKYSLEKKLRD